MGERVEAGLTDTLRSPDPDWVVCLLAARRPLPILGCYGNVRRGLRVSEARGLETAVEMVLRNGHL